MTHSQQASTHRPGDNGEVTPTNFQDYPHSAWGFHHVRHLHPSAPVSRGPGPAEEFVSDPQEVGSINFHPPNHRKMTIAEMIETQYTDGSVVLHRGRIEMEHYGHGMRPFDTHILMSTTKSFTGSLAGILVSLGALNESALVNDVLPFLEGTAYRGATIRNLLDMRIGLDFSEDYADPRSDFAYMDAACGWRPRIDEGAPDNLFDFIQSIRPNPPHGRAFHYVSPNAVVLGWALEAVTGARFADLLSTHIWQPMHAEHDADLILDRRGMSQTEGGLNVTLRDLARFGELHRCEGVMHGQQIVPAQWIADLREKGDVNAWNDGVMSERLPGHHYRSQWYVHRAHPHRPYFTLGAFGQTLYVDPVAELVMAKLSCHPGGNDFDKVLPAYRAIGEAFAPN